MVKVEYTQQAISDIDDIANYISNDSSYYASLQVEKLFNKTEILEYHPHIGRVVPELNIKSIRELIEGNYRIIYRVVNKDCIHILTIHHSRKQLKPAHIKRIYTGKNNPKK